MAGKVKSGKPSSKNCHSGAKFRPVAVTFCGGGGGYGRGGCG